MTEAPMSLIAVLAASLLGSLHCVGMCGGFVALYSTNGSGQSRSGQPGQGKLTGAKSHAAYHLGRLVSYASLGALAGLLGGHLNLAGSTLLGVQRVAAVAMGVLLIFMGLRALGLVPALRRSQPETSADSQAASQPMVQLEEPRSVLVRLRRRVAGLYRRRGPGPAFLVGLLSTALPCGWLWGFVAVAGATGSAWMGGIWMAAFWLGTVPILGSLGVITRAMGSKLRPYAPRLTAAVMILAGALALTGKMPGAAHAHAQHEAPAASAEAAPEAGHEAPAEAAPGVPHKCH